MLRIVQPALPIYRLDFFHRVNLGTSRDCVVYYSESDIGNISVSHDPPDWACRIGRFVVLPFGLSWQVGALTIPLNKGDTLVVCGAPKTVSTMLLLLRARLLGVRTVWWGHFWGAYTTPMRLWFRLLLARTAHRLIFYTDAELKQAKQHKLMRGRAISALNNGLDVSNIFKFKESYLNDKRGKRFLFIGRLTKKSNFNLILDALSSNGAADLTVEVIGCGDQLLSIKQRANSLGVSNRLNFHGDIIDEYKISKIANSCIAFVYPGAVGLSLIHAMAYGLPSIVHDDRSRHMPEIAAFRSDITGLSFKRGDAHSLAYAMKTLASMDKSGLSAMSNHSLDAVEFDFNTENMSARFLRAL